MILSYDANPAWMEFSERTGNFADFWLELAEAHRFSEGTLIGCERNSLAAKQGKFAGEQGTPKAHERRVCLMCKSACACRVANITLNDAMILPYDANPGRVEFSERTGGA
jgi:hypothetical protein